MHMTENKRNTVLQVLLWILQGFIIGVGAILPGVSGGTLCYAFGIYASLLEVLSNPFKGVVKHWRMLIFVVLGGAIGFIGFSGVTAALLEWNEPVVLCVFVGLILGTIPELWRDSGERGRSKRSILSLFISFFAIAALFYLCENAWSITIPENIGGFAVCGVIWGLSFIVPGFSSSTLLLFFGIYGAMSEGISRLEPFVVLPLGATAFATLLLFSHLMKWVFEKFHSVASHSIMGFVLATTLMILTKDCILQSITLKNALVYLICIACGAAAGFSFTLLCAKMKPKEQEPPEATE